MAQSSKTGQPQTRRLGDLLVAEGLITDTQLKQALGDQKGKTDKLGSILVKLAFITEEQLIGFLSRQYGIPSITLERVEIDADTIRLVPTAIALKYEVLPVKRIGGTLTLAMADPTNVFALDDIAFMTNLQILPVVAPQAAIRKGIEKYYEAPTSSMSDMLSEITAEAGNVEVVEGGEDESAKVDIFELKESSEEAPVIKLVNMVLVMTSLLTWMERKQSAVMQDRIGANRAAFFRFRGKEVRAFGLFHIIADALKMFFKEDYTPPGGDKLLHPLPDGVAIAAHAARNLLAAGLNVTAVVRPGCSGSDDGRSAAKTIACGAGELCSPRNIAGGYGNPLRVPMAIVAPFAARC